ncbi:MAG: extracellular solute-binding protein [Microcystaceae cyanobacterium]
MFVKKLIPLIVIFFVIIIGISGCSNLNSSTNDFRGNILFWIEQPDGLTETEKEADQRRIKEGLAEFEVLYPNIKVLIDFFDLGQALEQFVKEAERGAGANILLIRVDSDISQLIRAEALASLDDYPINFSKFSPKALEQAKYGGRIYGLPLFLSTKALCYNNDKVQQPAQTLDELVEQARKGYSVGMTSGFQETLWGTGIFAKTYLELLLEADEDTDLELSDDTTLLSSLQRGGWPQWMEWLKNAQNEPNFILSQDKEALYQAFLQNRLAYLTCSSDWIPYAARILGNDTLGVAVLPHKTNPATPPLKTWMFIFNKASSFNQMNLALKLAEFFTNTQQQRRLVAEEIMIPSNIEVSSNPFLYPIRTTLMQQSQSSLSFSLNDLETLNQITETAEQLYRQVLLGETTSEAAANELKTLINNQLNP